MLRSLGIPSCGIRRRKKCVPYRFMRTEIPEIWVTARKRLVSLLSCVLDAEDTWDVLVGAIQEMHRPTLEGVNQESIELSSTITRRMRSLYSQLEIHGGDISRTKVYDQQSEIVSYGQQTRGGQDSDFRVLKADHRRPKREAVSRDPEVGEAPQGSDDRELQRQQGPD
ncbi:hypothetical protein Tco_1273815 [Tanacetum coccineum]